MINSLPLNKLLSHLVHSAQPSQCVFFGGHKGRNGGEEVRGSSASYLLDADQVTSPF